MAEFQVVHNSISRRKSKTLYSLLVAGTSQLPSRKYCVEGQLEPALPQPDTQSQPPVLSCIDGVSWKWHFTCVVFLSATHGRERSSRQGPGWGAFCRVPGQGSSRNFQSQEQAKDRAHLTVNIVRCPAWTPDRGTTWGKNTEIWMKCGFYVYWWINFDKCKMMGGNWV